MTRDEMIEISKAVDLMFPIAEETKKWKRKQRGALARLRAIITGMMIGSKMTTDQIKTIIEEIKAN